MRKHAAVLLAALTLALWPRAARALEISLEENRGERGSIGFVDLQAVFRRFPETLRAKQSYAEVVRQAEEQVNLKKAALMELHSELAALKVQREEAAKAPLFVAPPPPQASTTPAAVPLSTVPVSMPLPAPAPAVAPPTPAPAVAPSTAPAKAEAPAAPPKGVAPAPTLAGLPGMAAPASTEPLKINIPGLPPESLPTASSPAAPAAVATAAAPAPAVAVPGASAVAVSSAPSAPPPPPGPSAAELQAKAEASLHERDAKVKELDAQLAAKETEIADKEKSLGVYEGQVEKDLVDIESKRSEMLLGRIYLAVRETAVENGVSVVIDKTAILYGQGSVDLTDKVLKKLEGNQP